MAPISPDETVATNNVLGKRAREKIKQATDLHGGKEAKTDNPVEKELKELETFKRNNLERLSVHGQQLLISSTRSNEIQMEHPHQSLALLKKELIDYAGCLLHSMKRQEEIIREEELTSKVTVKGAITALDQNMTLLEKRTKNVLICVNLLEQIETESRGRICALKFVPKLFSPFSTMDEEICIMDLPPITGCLLVLEKQDGRCAPTYTTFDGAQAMRRLECGAASSATFANAGFTFTAGNQSLTVNIIEYECRLDKSRVAATVLETPLGRYKLNRVMDMIQRCKSDWPDALYLATMARMSNLLSHLKKKHFITFKLVITTRREFFSDEEKELVNEPRNISRRDGYLNDSERDFNEPEMFKHMDQNFTTQDFEEHYATQSTSYVMSMYMEVADNEEDTRKNRFLKGKFRIEDITNMRVFQIYNKIVDG